jgi:zinc-binding alcohol dehydrogenase/oxidoreductase
MKALILTDKNRPLTIQEVPDLVACEDDAIVKICAAALNHRDCWIQKGQYAGLKYPIILGSDGSGVVHATGSVRNAHWIGKDVIINPALNWGSNQSYQDPIQFSILGLPVDGTLAEYVKVPVKNLAHKPKYLSFEEAAALPLAGLTAFRALLKRANLESQEKVLVTGIGGGVALFLLQFATATQADVYVTSSDEEKNRKAINLGAKGAANYSRENWVEIIRQQAHAFDVIIDGAAGNNLNDLLNLAKPGGRIVLYGATRGNPANITARRIFWKQLNVLGSSMGSPTDFQEMIEFVQKNMIRPVIDKVFNFREGEAAMQRILSGKHFGKIVISVIGQ